MLQLLRRPKPVVPEPARHAAAAYAPDDRPALPDAQAGRAMEQVSELTSNLGREAAEVRGVLDDTARQTGEQATAVQALARRLGEVLQAQDAIGVEVSQGLEAVARVGDAVQGVGSEVAGIVATLQQVSAAAQEITQIALQTRLVAFNASVEAKRAGEAGRGFGVVADAVKDLAAQVEQSSKAIMGTVAALGGRIDVLSREVSRDADGQAQGGVHRALASVEQGVRRIQQASDGSREVCRGVDEQMGRIEGEMRRTTEAVAGAFTRTNAFLEVSEKLIETVAGCGIETADSPFIAAAQRAAGRISALLEAALDSGGSSESELFDEQYRPVPGSQPAQVTTCFVPLAERLFPQVQEEMLELSDKVVFCIASDRNGYIACHNQQYNHPQRPGDVLWNTAHCRNRRIFNDRTGLASSRNRRPFLLQTYRRDMGGGRFVVMKEASAPIVVKGRHWGGLRLAYTF